MSGTATPIGIAVVMHCGACLVGTRGVTGPLPNCSEFPGGKCHVGESPRDCAQRECFEETGLRVEPIELLLNRTFEYSHGRVDLSFWFCRPTSADDVSADHHGFRWVATDELTTLNFPDANQPILEAIVAKG